MMTDEDIKRVIVEVYKKFEDEDQPYRDNDLPKWEKLDYYWRGIQYLYWSVSRQALVPPTYADLKSLGDDDEEAKDQFLYQKVVNIFRAHGESFVAALSTLTPPVRCFPDNAELMEDIVTARNYTTAAELIQKRNEAPLLWMQSLYTIYTQDFVAAYVYKKEDPGAGTYKIPQYEESVLKTPVNTCADCGQTVQFMNGECPECGSQTQPITNVLESVQKTKTGEVDSPKLKTCIDIFGPRNVKIRYKMRDQKDLPYLCLELDQSYAAVRAAFPVDKYPDLKLTPDESTDKFSRSRGYYQKTITTKRVWMRPWAFEALEETRREEIDQLKAMFPDGCHAVIIKDDCAEYRNEAMDAHWKLYKNPISEYMHGEPVGAPIVPLQDVKNDLTNYTLQSIEYGIPITFAGERSLDFDRLRKIKSRHGLIFPMSEKPGMSLSDRVVQTKTASLSREIEAFAQTCEQDAQFLLGDFPSVYGGPAEGGSKTLGEYVTSKNQALQRLGIYWRNLSFWWADTIRIAIDVFIECMKEMATDERDVRFQDGSYLNVYVRNDELGGKVGRIEAESSETFPLSSGMKRDLLVQLITLNNEQINAALFDPSNYAVLRNAIGLVDFHIPGEDQRNKQFQEIFDLLQSQPMMAPVLPGQPEVPPEPSIMPEKGVDDDMIHVEMCRSFLVSPIGLDQKVNNPAGYQNVVAHMQAHLFNYQMTVMMSQPPPEEPGKASPPKPKESVE